MSMNCVLNTCTVARMPGMTHTTSSLLMEASSCRAFGAESVGVGRRGNDESAVAPQGRAHTANTQYLAHDRCFVCTGSEPSDEDGQAMGSEDAATQVESEK